MSKRRLNLVPGGALGSIVRTAVVRSLAHAEPSELADVLSGELVRAIRGAARSVHGMSRRDVLDELEHSNHDLVRARDRARIELEELKRESAAQRLHLAEAHDDLLRMVDGGAAGREERAVARVTEVFERARSGELPLESLQARMKALVLETARLERRELLVGLTAERDRQIDLLERRIAKLNRSLELSEAALHELAARKSLDAGLASIYRTVQGLAADDPGAAEKRVLLEELFVANLRLRGLQAELERLPHGVAG